MPASTDTAGPGERERPPPRPAGPAGLYVHVPFCVRRCDYCDFASGVYDRAAASAYIDALSVELDMRAAGTGFETVYVGGGTPTALDHDQLERLLATLKPHLGGAPSEFTVEANPGTLDAAKVLLMRARGVNRVSLGVQSFSDQQLGMLGRAHSAEQARQAYRLLREREFASVSVDLMIALPLPAGGAGGAGGGGGGGGDDPGAESDVEAVIELAPEHVSAYILSVEPGTRLAGRIEAGELVAADDDRAAREYELVRARLAEAGYGQYEISNFARPGHESLHNLAYWTGRAYLGVGASAASFTGFPDGPDGRPGLRSTNVREAAEYVRRLRRGEPPTASMERLAPEAAAREALVLRLRMTEGVDRDEFRRAAGRGLEEIAGGQLRPLIDRGLLEESGRFVRLTQRGLLVADPVMGELV